MNNEGSDGTPRNHIYTHLFLKGSIGRPLQVFIVLIFDAGSCYCARHRFRFKRHAANGFAVRPAAAFSIATIVVPRVLLCACCMIGDITYPPLSFKGCTRKAYTQASVKRYTRGTGRWIYAAEDCPDLSKLMSFYIMTSPERRKLYS